MLGQLIVTLANNAWLNLGLGGVLIFFALSLFGMYEIELPTILARFTSSREGKGGYAGTFFMALTFTITSFTCTGPFLGPLLVGVKELNLSFGELVLSSLAYSATFAAPFFVLALFPRLLKTLPKSGGWLNSVKVVMGFLELAAALKFLGNTDIGLNPGQPADLQLRNRAVCLDRPVAGVRPVFARHLSAASRFAAGAHRRRRACCWLPSSSAWRCTWPRRCGEIGRRAPSAKGWSLSLPLDTKEKTGQRGRLSSAGPPRLAHGLREGLETGGPGKQA